VQVARQHDHWGCCSYVPNNADAKGRPRVFSMFAHLRLVHEAFDVKPRRSHAMRWTQRQVHVTDASDWENSNFLCAGTYCNETASHCQVRLSLSVP